MNHNQKTSAQFENQASGGGGGGLIGKTMGLKHIRCGYEKAMNGADFHVFLSEVSGANPVFHLYFSAEKGNSAQSCLLCNIQLRSDKVE